MSRGRMVLYALASGALIFLLYRLVRDEDAVSRPARKDARTQVDGGGAIVVAPSAPPTRLTPRLLRGDAGPARNEEPGQLEGFVRRYRDGRPIVGALLVFASRSAAGGQVAVSSAANGRYRVTLPPGAYQLRLRAPGYAAPRDPLELVVVAGAVAPSFHLDLHQLVRLEGRVEGTDGAPIAGAQISVLSARHPSRGELAAANSANSGVDAGVSYSGPRGRFSLLLPPGRVVLRVVQGRSEQYVGPLYLPDAGTVSLVAGLRVRAGSGAGETLTGRIVGPGAARVASAAVWLKDELGRRKVACDADGRFTVSGLMPGRKLLQAEGQGYSPSRVVASIVRSGERNKVVLELAPLRTISGKVRSGVDASGVSSAHGVGVGDVRLRARLATPAGGPGVWLAQPLVARSGVDGSYRFNGVPDLPLLLAALAPDGRRARRGGVAPGSREVDLMLLASGGIVGRVTDRKSGRPLGSFSLRLVGEGQPAREVFFAARSGHYALEGLAQGVYNVSAHADRRAARVLPQVSVIGGANVSSDAALEPAGRIVGVVHDRRGAALPGAKISLDDEAGTSAESDGLGRYQLRGVGPGRRTLTVSRRGFVGTTVRGVTVFADQQATASIASLKPQAQGRVAAARLLGVGLTLELVDKRLLIERVEPGSAAAAAGLRSGDRILMIDGAKSSAMRYIDARQRLSGLAGTVLALHLRRVQDKQRKNFQLGLLRQP